MAYPFERDTSGFARASHQSQALCLGCLGAAGVLSPVATYGFDSPLRIGLGWIAAAAGAYAWVKAREHWRLHGNELPIGSVAPLGTSEAAHQAGDAVPAMPASLYENGQLHPMVRRLLDIAASRFPDKLVLDPAGVELEDDGKGGRKLVSWRFHCVESGYLTQRGIQEKLQSTFLKGIGGVWTPDFDVRGDSFGMTNKSSIQKLVFPPDWPVALTPDEARSKYIGWDFKIGVSERGEEGIIPQKMAHIMCIGESGSGKSVSVRSWLEQFRAAGWQLILADGKGPDYVGYSAPHADDHNLPVPGTVAVGLGSADRGMSYIGAITLAYQIMQERQNGAVEAKIRDPDGWSNFLPVLLVMDEIKGMREKWKSGLSRAEQDTIKGMVNQILALGREFRVHCLLVSQDARDESIPNTWKTNIPVRICLGKPQPLTLKYAFEDSVRPKVQRISESMDPKIKGRCVFASVDEETGAADATQYQGYLGYAPGESWNNDNLPPETKKHWPSFKKNVSDKIPRMYTRQWFIIDEKSEAQQEAEAKSGEDMGYIDFDMFSVDEVMRMRRVGLDMRTPDGHIVPDLKVAKYDPSSSEYVCKPVVDTSNTVNAEL